MVRGCASTSSTSHCSAKTPSRKIPPPLGSRVIFSEFSINVTSQLLTHTKKAPLSNTQPSYNLGFHKPVVFALLTRYRAVWWRRNHGHASPMHIAGSNWEELSLIPPGSSPSWCQSPVQCRHRLVTPVHLVPAGCSLCLQCLFRPPGFRILA